MITFEGQCEPEKDDGGQALIAEFGEASVPQMFVRLQSWDEQKQHQVMRDLEGKRLRITVEVIG